MTQYFSIRGDAMHSRRIPFAEIISAVNATFACVVDREGELVLDVLGRRLWLVPVLASAEGNYACLGASPPHVNLIDVRASYQDWPTEQALADSVRPLCQRLAWELVSHDGSILVPAPAAWGGRAARQP